MQHKPNVCHVLSFRQDLSILVNLKDILDDTFPCLGAIKELFLRAATRQNLGC